MNASNAPMLEPHEGDDNDGRSAGDWAVAGAIAAVIVICLAAFILIFVRLDPYLSDFRSNPDLGTPVTNDASPTTWVRATPGQDRALLY